MTRRALIVDDEPDIRELLSITLGRMDVDCTAVGTVADAEHAILEGRFDLCLTDMRLPDGDGLDLVKFIQKRRPELPVAVITAHGSMETAITGLKNGAFDFVTKPVDLGALRNLVEAALRLSERRVRPKRALIGESDAIAKLKETIYKLARSQAPVYISGESGTGKELVARMIHDLGPRGGAPFVPVNCGAIPSELMESELFGHKKGSFTGAVADKAGLFESAGGGTLFLDEVAELPLNMQVKLLRAIQEKSVRPVGAETEVPVDCRILSATHKDLEHLVAEGAFRQDLYYRVNVIELKVPPLRERGADLEVLADHFLTRLSLEMGVEPPVLTTEARAALVAYPFPGNVRELENVIERAMTLCDEGRITAADLDLKAETGKVPPVGVGPTETGELQTYLDEVERQRILAALEKTRWNKTRAAKELGITFRALRYRLEKLGLDKDGA